MKAIFFIFCIFLWEIHCYIQRLKPVNQKVLWMIIKYLHSLNALPVIMKKWGLILQNYH
ncbi:hypothetical protein ECSTEC7V_0252 [Escherichia coli STEC_7v]|nr:hypothetical protein ECSTEC7V_0252 [Escherichia coli STEC_7v]